MPYYIGGHALAKKTGMRTFTQYLPTLDTISRLSEESSARWNHHGLNLPGPEAARDI